MLRITKTLTDFEKRPSQPGSAFDKSVISSGRKRFAEVAKPIDPFFTPAGSGNLC